MDTTQRKRKIQANLLMINTFLIIHQNSHRYRDRRESSKEPPQACQVNMADQRAPFRINIFEQHTK